MSNEELVTLGELEYAVNHVEDFNFGDFQEETICSAIRIIDKLDRIIQSFESGEMTMGVKNMACQNRADRDLANCDEKYYFCCYKKNKMADQKDCIKCKEK